MYTALRITGSARITAPAMTVEGLHALVMTGMPVMGLIKRL